MTRGFKPGSSQIITFLAAFICQVNSYTNTETRKGLLSAALLQQWAVPHV